MLKPLPPSTPEGLLLAVRPAAGEEPDQEMMPAELNLRQRRAAMMEAHARASRGEYEAAWVRPLPCAQYDLRDLVARGC